MNRSIKINDRIGATLTIPDCKLRTALVYDWVDSWGGAERLLLALHKLFPDAPLYTSIYNPGTAAWAKAFKVIPSFLNKIPLVKSNRKLFPPLMPMAFEAFDFSEYDLVISVTSAFAKGVITSTKTKHLCICLTPTRFLWSERQSYFGKFYRIVNTLTIPDRLKRWDLIASRRPDVIIAISNCVKKRIKKYYGIEAKVVYPPIDLDRFKIKELRFTNEKKFYLIVSRLVKYKKVDMVIEAFNKLGSPLKIIGVGPEFNKLKTMARGNIELLGRVDDEQLVGYYQNCQAVIFPQEEDFGLVPLETQACGRPVIAYRGGGSIETVVENVTGIFYNEQSEKSLAEAIMAFESRVDDNWSNRCRENAERFTIARFNEAIKMEINKLVSR